MGGDYMSNMIGCISCLLCGLPFLIIGVFDKKSSTPINLWSGDTSLKEKVKNIPAYNEKMSKLYRKYWQAWVLCGICMLISWAAGMVFLILICTAGIYWLYKKYQKILCEFSDMDHVKNEEV